MKPKLRVTSISFNYHQGGNGAFSIARVSDGVLAKVEIPEWTPNKSDPAAFRPTDKRHSIRVTFESEGSGPECYVIGAKSVGSRGFAGEVLSREVNFLNGEGEATFILGGRILEVGRLDVSWQWHYFITEESKEDFDTTKHRIYSVLGPPKYPWHPECATVELLPRVEALDVACHWASGSNNLIEIPKRITEKIFGLGATQFIYGNPAFTRWDRFKLELAIATINSGTPSNVDCTDCATLVVTFSNLLGCCLEIIKLQDSRFSTQMETNLITLIGRNQGTYMNFGTHEIAVQFAAGESDLTWDACLAFNENGTNRLPVGLPFGAQGEPGSYRSKFLKPDAERCVTATRVGVRGIHSTARFLTLEYPLDPYRFQFNEWFEASEPIGGWKGYSVWGLNASRSLLADWVPIREKNRDVVASPGPNLIESHWRVPTASGAKHLRLRMFECGSRRDAHLALFQLIDSVSIPGFYKPNNMPGKRRKEQKRAIGDVSFGGHDPSNLLFFVRGNLVVEARLYDGESGELTETITKLDAFLIRTEAEGDRTRVKPSSGIDSELPPPTDDGPWYRIFTDHSEIELQQKIGKTKAVLTSIAPGVEKIHLTAFREGGGALVPIQKSYSVL